MDIKEIKPGAIVYSRTTGEKFIVKGISFENRVGWASQLTISQARGKDPEKVDVIFTNGSWATLEKVCSNYYLNEDEYEMHRKYVEGLAEYPFRPGFKALIKAWKWWRNAPFYHRKNWLR